MFYAAPSKVKDTQLCRTIIEAMEKGDTQFAIDTSREAVSRGLTLEACEKRVATENGVLIATAIVATAVGVGIACQNANCGGMGSGLAQATPAYGSDVDCAGGGGDGPRYVQGPFRLNGTADVYGLDRDRDGIACEPWGDEY
ncbi:MAG: hypothetical protein ABL962_04385 [Fimbriimonadaceae bacterium]